MRRGTTPINTFLTDIDLSDATVFISYAQNHCVVVEKTNDSLTFSPGEKEGEYVITLVLSQEDTLALRTGDVLIQIRAVYADGSAIASNIIRTTADIILKDGVISYV